MISIDTNVLVRLLTWDDQEQAEKAKALFSQENIFITKTVILETEWVLRFAYHFSTQEIANAFVTLSGQHNVTIEDIHHITVAIDFLRQGMDFADALHLLCSQDHRFFTFDKRLDSKAKAIGINAVQLV